MYTTVWNFHLFYNNYCILFTFIRNLNWIFFVQKLHCKMTAKDPYKCCPPQFMWKWFGQRSHTRQQSGGEHGCQIFPCTYNVPKRGKIYQMTTKCTKCLYEIYTKWTSNITNGHKIYQHFPFQSPPKYTQTRIFGLKIYAQVCNAVPGNRVYTQVGH
jgi:hypothetical protein